LLVAGARTAPLSIALSAITASPGVRDQLRAGHMAARALSVKPAARSGVVRTVALPP